MPDLPGFVPPLIAAVVVLIFLLILFKMSWKIAEPNEALLISGRKSKQMAADKNTDESMTFKIVTGGGALVIPGLQTARTLKLNLVETSLQVDCVTKQGIPVQIEGSVIFKIGDTFPEIANAARRFLDQQNLMVGQVHSIFSGHLRAIVGNMTVEALLSDREEMRDNVREASGTEMANLGLKIDSMQMLKITDPTGYIANLSAPHIAQAEANARIARAERGQEATLREQTSAIAVAESVTASEKRQSALKGEADKAREEALQAGPLARAEAQQKVTVAETRAAELQADLRAQELETEVRRPADAAAYQTKVDAEAQRDAAIARAEGAARQTTLDAEAQAAATKLRGEAEANTTRVRGEAEAAATQAKGLAEGASVKARGLAEAEAMSARAEALAANQEAVIQQQVAELLPEIVRAAASPFASIDSLTVLNGAEGVNGIVGGILAQVGSILPGIMESLNGANGNGQGPTHKVPVKRDVSGE